MVVQRSFVGIAPALRGGALFVGCVLALAAVSISGCGSEPAKKKAATADQGAMTPAMAAAGSGNFGNVGEAGSPSTTTPPTTTPTTTSGSGGSASAGSGGSAGADSGAGAGGDAGMAGSSSAGSEPDAGMPAEEDPFAGLFDPGPVSCDGYICLEAADCASLYPEENTTCKFTNCVDFMCTK